MKELVTESLCDEMVNTFLLFTPNSDAEHTSTVVWQRFTFPEDSSRNYTSENTGGLKKVCVCFWCVWEEHEV